MGMTAKARLGPEIRALSELTMESIMKKLAVAISVVALAVAASVSMAGPGGGYGPGAGCGMGAGPGAGGANCPAGGGGFGPGPGYGRGGGGGGYGMSLLTQEERIKFRDAMHEVKTVAECTAVVEQRHALIAERAKEKGVTIPAAPSGNMCERMKARGFIS
ncbi:MAG: hypothetical protein U1F58_13185 [Burkholderiales bacterium]